MTIHWPETTDEMWDGCSCGWGHPEYTGLVRDEIRVAWWAHVLDELSTRADGPLST